MNLREKKTIRDIQDAFLQLRARKPLERITVRELVELAEVGKSTFYLHYKDIYDLCDQMQKEVIQNIFADIPRYDVFFTDTTLFSREMFQAFVNHSAVTDILFSGRQYYVLAHYIEQGMREYFFRDYPELKGNMEFGIWLSLVVHGAFSAYVENHETFGDENTLQLISSMMSKISPPHL